MKLRFSLLALATTLLITTTAFAQEQPLSLQERCAAWKAQTQTGDTAPGGCLGAKSQRVNGTDAQIELLLPGEILSNFSVDVTPLKITQETDSHWSQTAAGEPKSIKGSVSSALPPAPSGSVMTLVVAKADSDANAVAIRWRFTRGLDAEGKPIDYDTTVIMKLSDAPESNVTTLTPAN